MYKFVLVAAFATLALADIGLIERQRLLSPFQNVRPLPLQPQVKYDPNLQYPNQIRILRQEQDISPDGSYRWAYETENGIAAQEQAVQKQISQTELATQAQGSYSYTAPDGTPITVTYIADENGFQPQGAHLPTPPPIPEAIQRALDFIARNPPQQNQQ